MFDIGFWELLLIAVVALLVVGPEKLPRLVRVAGLWLGRANASLQSIKNEIATELRAEELKQALKKPDDLPDMNEIIDTEPKVKKARTGKQNNSSSPAQVKDENQDGNK